MINLVPMVTVVIITTITNMANIEDADSADEEEYEQKFKEMNFAYHYDDADAAKSEEEDDELEEVFSMVLEQIIEEVEVSVAIPNNKSDLIFFDVAIKIIASSLIKSLCDPGAAVSLIQEEIIPQEKRNLIKKCRPIGVVGFNSKTTLIDRQINLRCSSGPTAWTDDFYVVPKSEMTRFSIQNEREIISS